MTLGIFYPTLWSTVRLVVFDVDGTLYCQRALRRKMAMELLAHCVLNGDLKPIRITISFRRLREQLAEQEEKNFLPRLTALTAAATGTSERVVQAIREEWIENRPLRHLATCRYAGVDTLFDGLRKNGRQVGIFSDYPAKVKLNALGLSANYCASAEDEDVGALKPNPIGLQRLMEKAGVGPDETLMIGDRTDRDGKAARRAGTHCLIRSSKPNPLFTTFRHFDDNIFSEFIGRH